MLKIPNAYLKAKTYVHILMIILVISSCKKDSAVELSATEQNTIFNKKSIAKSISSLPNEQKINNARSWYDSQSKLSSATIQTSSDEKVKLIFNPEWDKATVESINGFLVTTTKVKTTLRNFDNGSTEFNLVIKFDGERYETKTVAVTNTEKKASPILSPTDLFSLAYCEKELPKDKLKAKIKVYSPSFKQEKEQIYNENGRIIVNFKSKKASNSQQSDVNITVCRDYWLVIDTYNSNNALVDSETTYLGNFCTEINVQTTIDYIDNGNGTYGGPSNNEEATVTATGVLISEGTPAEVTEQGILRKSWNVTWEFGTAIMSGYTVSGHSTELMKAIYHQSTGWIWDTVTNQSISTAGTRPTGMGFVKKGYATTLYNTTRKAHVEVAFALEYVSQGTTKSTIPTSEDIILDLK